MARSEIKESEAEQTQAAVRASVGTSGFSYRDWKSVLYPDWLPTRDRFHYYATQFQAVEINLTFYRPPTARMIERWKASVAADFDFVLKASQVVTHQRRLIDCADDIEAMIAAYTPLGRQLSCILYQLPPSLSEDLLRLKQFVSLAARSFQSASVSPHLAFEFRHASWNTAETFDLLTRRGCGMVLHDMQAAGGWLWKEGKLEAGRLSLTVADLIAPPVPLIYLRFHGTQGKYAGEYGQRALEPWATLAHEALEKKIRVHAYFNNTRAGAAVQDALRFAEMLKQ